MNILVLIGTALSLSFSTNSTPLLVQHEVQDMVDKATVHTYNVAVERVGKSKGYVVKEKGFECTFPGEPSKSSQDVETDVGDIEMTTYMYEFSSTYVMMVAVSDYPKEYVKDSDPLEMLQGGKDGACGSLGIRNLTKEKSGMMDGNNFLEFYGDNSEDFVYYKMILRENRLYQVAILRTGTNPKNKDVKKYAGSFKLI